MTPAIEKMSIENSTININVNMTLASMPVVVRGQYNVRSNSFWPSMITPKTDLEFEPFVQAGDSMDLEEFCELAGWDYFDTHKLIQETVEAR